MTTPEGTTSSKWAGSSLHGHLWTGSSIEGRAIEQSL